MENQQYHILIVIPCATEVLKQLIRVAPVTHWERVDHL